MCASERTGWKHARLDELCFVSLGRTPARAATKYWTNGEIPWVSIADLNNGDVETTAEKISLDAHAAVFGGRFVPAGTVLLSFKLTIGKVGILAVPAVHNEAIANLRVKSAEIDRDFLFYQLQQIDYDQYLDSYVKGRTLNKDKVSALRISVPPLAEQRAIASICGRVKYWIELARRSRKYEQERRAALSERLFESGVTGGLAVTTPIGIRPQSWAVRRVEEVCRATIDCPHTTPRFTAAGMLVVRNTNVRDGRLILKPAFYTSAEEYRDRTRRCTPASGDVLFSREAPIGEACVIPEGVTLSLGQRMMLLRPNPAVINSSFLVYAIYSHLVRPRMLARGTGVTTPHLNVEDVRKFTIPVPPLDEQGEIVGILGACDARIAALEREIELFEELFKAALEEFMTGRLSVTPLIEEAFA